MNSRDLLACGTENGVIEVLRIQKEGALVQSEHICTIHLPVVFQHFGLTSVDTNVYFLEFIGDASRLLIGTSHGILSVSIHNVHSFQDYVWSNMIEEEQPCVPLVINHDFDSAITVNGTYLDVWRVSSDGRLSGPWQLSSAAEGQISCLATNTDQDIGIGRENGVVECWHPGTIRGPERHHFMQTGVGSEVLALGMSRPLVCAVNNDQLHVINWVDVQEMQTIDEIDFVPLGFIFPKRDASRINEVKYVLLVQHLYALPYDVQEGDWSYHTVEIMDPMENSTITCCAQGYNDVYFGTTGGVIKHSFFRDEGYLSRSTVLNLPHGDGSINCIALSEHVFDRVRVRERGWELLYPVACAVGVRDEMNLGIAC